MFLRLFLLTCFLLTAKGLAQFVEPTGGLYPTYLLIFKDDVREGITGQFWGCQTSIDKSVRKSGFASWRFDVGNNPGGGHIMWGGWGRDTTVFWVHRKSRVNFWIRPSTDNLQIQIQLGYMDGQYDVMQPTRIGSSGEWKYYDVPVPSAATGRPLNDIKLSVTGGPGTIHLDEFKITDVRLYAGRGEAMSITGVFADQIGYDTRGIKTFSSEKYSSYQIVRVGDKKVMYTGTDRRTTESRYVGDYTVSIGNFTDFTTPGKYFIRLDNGKTSYPFEIGPDVYDATLRAAIRFFYYQRNNTEIKNPYAEGPWVHEKDNLERVRLPRSMGGTKIVRKGWHDAGDLAIYMPNHTYACFWLAAAWDDFRFDSDRLNIPESGNGVPDLLDELRWGLDWILDMQDTDGGFFQNMCVREGSPYRYGRTTPLTISGYELTNKATAATASASAVLAYASTLFDDPKLDRAYARKMLDAARKGWQWLERNPRQIFITEGCNTYQDDSDIHARVFAAAALFLATGDSRYDRYFLANDPGSNWISDYNNQTNLAYLLYLKSTKGDSRKQATLRNLLVDRAQEANGDREKHPFGFVGYYYWGSLGTSFARVGNYNLFDWRLNNNLNSLYTAQQQLHYTFGQNSLNFVYFSGFGTQGMKEAFHHWLKVLNATPHNFPGLLPGGPNENPDANDRSYPPAVYGYWGDPRYPRDATTPVDQRYTDNDSWSTNEIAVNQTAQLVYTLCAARAYAKEMEKK